MKSKRVINIITLVIGISALAFLVYKVGMIRGYARPGDLARGIAGLSLEITRRLGKIVFQVLGIFLMVGAVKSSGSRDGEK